MPELGRYKPLLDVVFFLYASADDARAGKDFGGTGFFVGLPTKRWPQQFVHQYAVTNWHVACRDGFSAIRVNTLAGETDIFDLGPHDWHFIPNKHDVAIAPISISAAHTARVLDPGFYWEDAETRALDIGPADDVFMIGRFIDYDGVLTNRPSMRFGNISMIDAPIRQSTGYMGGSFVVDMHSRTGFSGSPVFVYRTAGSIFAEKNHVFTGGHLLRLLGIHWGQFPEEWEIKDAAARARAGEASKIRDGKYVSGMSGMTCVCPSQAIQDILLTQKLADMRERAELHLMNTNPPPTAAISETARTTTDLHPEGRERFKRLLDAAARKRPEGGKT